MIEFLFHHETAASLSEMAATDKQRLGRRRRHSHSSSPNAAMTLRELYSSNNFQRDRSLRPASLAALVRGTPWTIRLRTSLARLSR
jgi:hypothetical protein